jgi:hypothetical protein
LSFERFQASVRLVSPTAVTVSRVGMLGGFLSRRRRSGPGIPSVPAPAENLEVEVPCLADAVATGPAMSINVRVLAAARDDAAMCFARFLATTKQGKVAATADGAPRRRQERRSLRQFKPLFDRPTVTRGRARLCEFV